MDSNIQSLETAAKKDRLFLLFLMFIPCLFIHLKFDSDTYWLVNSGRYVLSHGIPHIDPFTLHQGLHYVMHQWLAATVFAIIYDTLGSPFLYVLVAVGKGLIIYSIFRLCLRVSEGNFLVSFTIAFAISIPLDFFMVPRPQLFSLLLFSLELNLLETAVQSETKNALTLLWLPIISVLLVNLHAAVWPFFFVLLIPYIIDSFHFSFWEIRGQGYSFRTIGTTTLLSLAAGWLNPYGIKSMTYLFRSYGHTYISAMVSEMQSPDFKSALGVIYFVIYFTPILIFSFHKDRTRLRYVLLLIGTGFMGLSSARSLSLFLICGIPFLAYPLKSIQILKSTHKPSRAPWLGFSMAAVLFIFIGIMFYLNAMKSEKEAEVTQPVKAVEFIKKNLDKDRIRLYTSFNAGGYAEFQGLRPFIDTRAEVFCKSNNRQENIIDDYFDVAFGKTHYRKLIEKYELTHFLVAKTDILYVYLTEDTNFELLFSDSHFKVFRLKNEASDYYRRYDLLK